MIIHAAVLDVWIDLALSRLEIYKSGIPFAAASSTTSFGQMED